MQTLEFYPIYMEVQNFFGENHLTGANLRPASRLNNSELLEWLQQQFIENADYIFEEKNEFRSNINSYEVSYASARGSIDLTSINLHSLSLHP
jgi:hypothetical protein